jgi:PAS domain-containing protein
MLSTSSGRQTAESDILDSELLRAVSRSLNDALALSDTHGIVLAVNAAYSKLYGFLSRRWWAVHLP